MDGKKIVLLVGALVMALTTAFMARSMLGGESAPQAQANAMPEADMPRVLVAAKALPVGTIIDAESFRLQPWPKELMEDAYFIQGKVNPSSLQGSVVRNAITAGQPLTQGALIRPGERGFLAAALGPGMRAVTVPVSAQTSAGGFIFPGDRVDMMLTQSVEGGGDGPPLKVSETILRNLRVLATDQRLDAKGEDGKPVVQPFSMVTLEVTPKLAEKISVAQTVGALSLTLRSIADNSSELDAAIASGAVDVPNDPKAEKTLMLSMANRPADAGGSTFATGADVSRYQRSTVPTKKEDNGAGGTTTGGTAGVPSGPVVRVARGASVEVVAVGGK